MAIRIAEPKLTGCASKAESCLGGVRPCFKSHEKLCTDTFRTSSLNNARVSHLGWPAVWILSVPSGTRSPALAVCSGQWRQHGDLGEPTYTKLTSLSLCELLEDSKYGLTCLVKRTCTKQRMLDLLGSATSLPSNSGIIRPWPRNEKHADTTSLNRIPLFLCIDGGQAGDHEDHVCSSRQEADFAPAYKVQYFGIEELVGRRIAWNEIQTLCIWISNRAIICQDI